PVADAECPRPPAVEHSVLHLRFNGGPSDRTERPRHRCDEEVHPTREEDDRCACTAVVAYELHRLSVDRSRPARDEPLLALPCELCGASPGEVCAGDAVEHRASVEPAEAVAESVPGAPHREHRPRLAPRHPKAG